MVGPRTRLVFALGWTRIMWQYRGEGKEEGVCEGLTREGRFEGCLDRIDQSWEQARLSDDGRKEVGGTVHSPTPTEIDIAMEEVEAFDDNEDGR